MKTSNTVEERVETTYNEPDMCEFSAYDTDPEIKKLGCCEKDIVN